MTDHSALIERLETAAESASKTIIGRRGQSVLHPLLAEAAEALRDLTEWRDMADAPDDGTRVLVDFDGAGPIVAFRDSADDERWVRYIGFGKSEHWPTVHADYALRWLPLPSAPNQAKEAGE